MIYNMSGIISQVRNVRVEEIRKRIETTGSDFALIDVREPKEYAQSHLPGAILMPLSQLPFMFDKIPTDKTVTVYCRSGKRSASAAALLSSYGIQDIENMEGGIMAWDGLLATGSPQAGLFLLEERTSPEDMLRLAWALEDGTRVFYERAKERLPGPEAGVVLGALIKAEVNHRQKILEAFQSLKPGATEGDIRDEKAAGYMEGGAKIEDALSWIAQGDRTPLDIIELCLLIEANALDLYMRLISATEKQEAKDILTPVIEEEKNHLRSLGKLFQDIL